MATVFPDAYYFSTPTILSDTAETTVYTCNNEWAFLTALWAADDGGSARTLTAVARIGGTDYTLFVAKAISANAELSIEFKPLVLKSGESIKCTASAGGVHVIVSGTEGAGRNT